MLYCTQLVCSTSMERPRGQRWWPSISLGARNFAPRRELAGTLSVTETWPLGKKPEFVRYYQDSAAVTTLYETGLFASDQKMAL
jgi:hypothetical protein